MDPSAATAHGFAPAFRVLRFPAGRTLRCALAVLGLTAACELAFWSIARQRGLDKDAGGNVASKEGTADVGPSLLIQPRLEAPEIRSAWQELVERSRAAFAKGETDTAIKLLDEAETQAPNQPGPLAEIAVQLEKCSAPGRAIKLWEKIHQFGTSAGVYYSAADAKLSLLQASGRESSSGEPSVNSKGGILHFTKVSLKENLQSSPLKRNFTLSVPVQKSGSQTIQVKDVSIQVQFYDQINGRTLERTNASIRWKWATAPVDWQDENSETLEVEYRQGPSRSNAEERRYFGYVASVYYKDKLLDTRSDPPRLGQQYPPPRILSKEVAP